MAKVEFIDLSGPAAPKTCIVCKKTIEKPYEGPIDGIPLIMCSNKCRNRYLLLDEIQQRFWDKVDALRPDTATFFNFNLMHPEKADKVAKYLMDVAEIINDEIEECNTPVYAYLQIEPGDTPKIVFMFR